jgi:hypothetical protein
MALDFMSFSPITAALEIMGRRRRRAPECSILFEDHLVLREPHHQFENHIVALSQPQQNKFLSYGSVT